MLLTQDCNQLHRSLQSHLCHFLLPSLLCLLCDLSPKSCIVYLEQEPTKSMSFCMQLMTHCLMAYTHGNKLPMSTNSTQVRKCCMAKTKNNTTRVRANVGMSINHLCDSIACTYETMSATGSRTSPVDNVFSQMIVFQEF